MMELARKCANTLQILFQLTLGMNPTRHDATEHTVNVIANGTFQTSGGIKLRNRRGVAHRRVIASREECRRNI
jgi:hypothetical protein